MGTSTPFGGPKNSNPLVPSFLQEPDGTPVVDTQQGADQPQGPPATPQALADVLKRFQGGRRSSNDYARSGGQDRQARGRALRSYVRRAGGGAAGTSRRMAVERRATATLAGILSRAETSAGGIREVARALDLGVLADAPIEAVYAALVDVICPPDGDLDDAHAREAYLEAVAEVMDEGYEDIEHPSAETVTAILGTYITNVIHIRVVNAIANGMVTLPGDVAEVMAVEAGMRDFIGGCVSDALREFSGPMPVNDIQARINDLYERAIQIVDHRADAEAEGDKR